MPTTERWSISAGNKGHAVSVSKSSQLLTEHEIPIEFCEWHQPVLAMSMLYITHKNTCTHILLLYLSLKQGMINSVIFLFLKKVIRIHTLSISENMDYFQIFVRKCKLSKETIEMSLPFTKSYSLFFSPRQIIWKCSLTQAKFMKNIY